MLIESLKVFRDLVDLGSFSKSAEANYVTQPAVSQQVKNLERFWKVRLMERDKRAISLTRAGEILYRKAKAILEQYDELDLLLKQTTRSVSGSVRIAAIHGVGLHELPPYIKRFLKLYPQVSVSLEYLQDSGVYEQVMNRRADLGIVAFPKPRPNLQVIPFRNDQLVLVCQPGHLLARYKKIEPSKIKGCNFVAFKKGLPTRKVVDEFLKRLRIPVEITMEFDNIETLKRAVEIDAGVSILPLVTVQQELERHALKAIAMVGPPLVRTLGILVQKKTSLPAATSKFIDVLLDRDGRL